MHASLKIISFLTASLLVAACDHKSPDDPVAAAGGDTSHVRETEKSPPASPLTVEAQNLSAELTKMGAPSAAWVPAMLQLFGLRLDRLEYVNKQQEDVAITRAVDTWRTQYDAVLIGNPKNQVAKESDLTCDMFHAAGNSTYIPSNAAFRCIDRTAKTAPNLASTFKETEGTTPEKCANNSTARLCQALIMVQQFNRSCGLLAQTIGSAKDKKMVIGNVLGCYLQITPVIEDNLKQALAEDPEIALYFQIELAIVERYQRVLELFRTESAE